MIGVTDTIARAVAGEGTYVLALQQPDKPFGDILGWLIVFVVVIWPIIRGLLENASTQRKKFEQQQKRAPRGSQGAGQDLSLIHI